MKTSVIKIHFQRNIPVQRISPLTNIVVHIHDLSLIGHIFHVILNLILPTDVVMNFLLRSVDYGMESSRSKPQT